MCVAKSQFQWLTSQLNNQSIYFNIKELKNCSKYEREQSKKGIFAQRMAEFTFVSSQCLVSRDLSKRV